MSKLNWVLFRQLMNAKQRRQHDLAPSDVFFGLINKASYRYAWRGRDCGAALEERVGATEPVAV